MNHYLEIIKEFIQKYKKTFFITVIFTISVIFLIVLISFMIAKWDNDHAVYYEVTFHTNGGTVVNSKKIRKGKKLNENIKTEKYGFEFLGWTYEGELFDVSNPIEKDIELYASFKKLNSTTAHTVSFETYGGTTIDSFEVSEGKTFTKPLEPKKEDYQFIGWYYDNEPYDFIRTAVSTDITLKAKWERKTYFDNTKNNLQRSEYLFNQLSGIWYLKYYEDIYLNFTEEDNGFGESWYFLRWYNIDLKDTFEFYLRKLYQRSFSSEKAEFFEKINQFHYRLENGELILEHNNEKYIFVREKGTKNKYTDTIYEKVVGRWYLENSYTSYIDFTNEKTNNILGYDTYCISSTNINLKTLQLGSSIEYGCRYAYDETLFSSLGITIDEEIMTITNQYGKKRFTFNKVVPEGSVIGVKLDKSVIKLETGNKYTLYATVIPKEANNTKVVWESSDSTIVEVTGNPNVNTESSEGVRYSGTLIAKRPGSVVVSVKTIDGNFIAQCKVTVPDVQIESINLNKKETTIYVGNFEQLKVKILPDNASNKTLIWSSSNPEVASVNQNGTIEGKKEGTAIITVTNEDGSKKATCVVTVKYMNFSVVSSMNETTRLIGGEYVKGIIINVTPSGGSGIYQSYNIKLYYNHELVKEVDETSLFYPTELKGSYYAEITVIDTEGHESKTTKEYIKR